MDRKILAIPAIALAAGFSLAACSKTTSHTAAEQSAKARVSAEATSSTAKQARSDAAKLLKKCPVPQGAAQLSKTAWETWAGCAGVPESKWKLTGGCVLSAVEHGGKLPAGKQARETDLINDAYPCVQQNEGGAK